MLGIYTRLSKEDENSTSIENQLREGKEFAKKEGFKDYEIFNEGEGVSGTLDIEERPQFKKLLDSILGNNLDAVWFRNNNRVERNSLTFHIFMDACKKTNTRIFLADKEFNYNNPNEFLTGSILSLLNGYSAQLQGVQTRKVLKDRIIEGKAHGVVAYGYSRDKNGYLEINQEESKIVKKIYELSLNGKGYRKIAEYLNDRSIPTRYNKYEKGTITTKNKFTGEKTTTEKKDIKWSPNTVRSIIVGSLYKGIRIWKGEEYKAPAIVTPEYWQKVNDNLKNNATNKTGRQIKHNYLLHGLLRCGKCGRNYYGRTRSNKKDHFYMCSSKRLGRELSCKQPSINIDVLENIVFSELFLHPENVQEIHNKFKGENREKEGLKNDQLIYEKKLKDFQGKKKGALQLAYEYPNDKEIKKDVESFNNKIEETEKKIKDLQQRLATEKENESNIEDYIDLMQAVGTNLTYQEIKELTNKLIKNIVLTNRGKKNWDVEIEFKTGGKIVSGTDNEYYYKWLKLKPFYERYKSEPIKNQKEYEEVKKELDKGGWNLDPKETKALLEETKKKLAEKEKKIKGEKKLFTSDNITSEIVWCGLLNGL